MKFSLGFGSHWHRGARGSQPWRRHHQLLGGYMTERNCSKICARGAIDRGVSRRDLLRMGTAIIPAGIFLPAWLTARAQQAAPSTFDYYVSPTGSDSNPGTLAAPWAITSASNLNFTSRNVANNALMAGKSVGFLPGTYDVSAMMPSTIGGALYIPAGTATANTYWASCDASGNYSLLTATLNAKGSNGLYGGHTGGPGNEPAIIGHLPETGPQGYIVIDGLVLTGFSYRAIRIGGQSYGGPEPITNPVTIQNCTFTGGGHNSGDSLDNSASLWMDGCSNWMVTNNLFLNSAPWVPGSCDHFNAILVGYCQNGTIQYNTIINAGNVYGKSFGSGTTGIGDEGNVLQYNYLDTSMYTVSTSGLSDFTGYPAPGLTQTTIFRNNVVLATIDAIGGYSVTSNWPTGFTTPVQAYNNTLINSGTGPTVRIGMSNSSAVTIYNNIITGKPTPVTINGGTVAILDYNLAASSISGGGSQDLTGTPTFVGGTPTLPAQAYQLATGSTGKGAGRAGGVASGAAIDMGAWGGTDVNTGQPISQIGCNLSAGAPTPTAVPNAPILTVT